MNKKLLQEVYQLLMSLMDDTNPDEIKEYSEMQVYKAFLDAKYLLEELGFKGQKPLLVTVVDDYDYETVGVAEFPNKKAFKDCIKAIRKVRDEECGYVNGLNDAYEVIETFGKFTDLTCELEKIYV